MHMADVDIMTRAVKVKLLVGKGRTFGGTVAIEQLLNVKVDLTHLH